MQIIDTTKTTLEHQIARRPWLDHLVRAGRRYQRQRGDYFAAGITYFTVLSLFPLFMVAFSIAGFVLAGNINLLARIQETVVENIPGDMGSELNELIDHAIASRTTVGILGLLTGLYTGLGWMANLRAALTEQWEREPEGGNWFIDKAADLGALVSLGLAAVLSLGLSALASGGVLKTVLASLGLAYLPGLRWVLTLVSALLAIAASWALFAWTIARLPRRPVAFKDAARAALLAALVFEVFKFVAAIYLRFVLNSPVGAAFGSVIGLMVFSYISYRILLFATAWAATVADTPEIPPPAPAIIRPRAAAPGISVSGAATAFGAGVLMVWGLRGFRRRR